MLNFSGRSQQPKVKRVFIKRKKQTEFIPSSDMKFQKSRILLTDIRCSELGKAVLLVSVADFSGALKVFRAKMAQPPRKKLARMPLPVVGCLFLCCFLEACPIT